MPPPNGLGLMRSNCCVCLIQIVLNRNSFVLHNEWLLPPRATFLFTNTEQSTNQARYSETFNLHDITMIRRQLVF